MEMLQQRHKLIISLSCVQVHETADLDKAVPHSRPCVVRDWGTVSSAFHWCPLWELDH